MEVAVTGEPPHFGRAHSAKVVTNEYMLREVLTEAKRNFEATLRRYRFTLDQCGIPLQPFEAFVASLSAAIGKLKTATNERDFR